MNGWNDLDDMGELASQTKTCTDLDFDEPSIGHRIGDNYGQSVAPHRSESANHWFGEAENSKFEEGKTGEKSGGHQIGEDFQEENR